MQKNIAEAKQAALASDSEEVISPTPENKEVEDAIVDEEVELAKAKESEPPTANEADTKNED